MAVQDDKHPQSLTDGQERMEPDAVHHDPLRCHRPGQPFSLRLPSVGLLLVTDWFFRHLVMKSGRYAHARQMKRAKACTRKLRTNLGRVIREIERQGCPAAITRLLTLCKRIHAQQRHDQAKVYSVHEPEVMCIAKGKAGKPRRC